MKKIIPYLWNTNSVCLSYIYIYIYWKGNCIFHIFFNLLGRRIIQCFNIAQKEILCVINPSTQHLSSFILHTLIITRLISRSVVYDILGNNKFLSSSRRFVCVCKSVKNSSTIFRSFCDKERVHWKKFAKLTKPFN